MYKIGIIGDRDTVQGFMALGFSVQDVAGVAEGVERLHKMVKSGEYAVIYVVENLAMQMEDQIAQYKDDPLPAIISIPGQAGSTGYGMNNIRTAVERAVGADILFKEEKNAGETIE